LSCLAFVAHIYDKIENRILVSTTLTDCSKFMDSMFGCWQLLVF